jgi:hypothetical protein
MSQSAQAGEMRILHPGSLERAGQRRTIELRIVTRSWNGADVNDTIDAVGGEQTDELVDRSCGMPNRENRGR